MPEDLYRDCSACDGTGQQLPKPPSRFVVETQTLGFGPKCGACDGWTVIPTDAGKPVFDLIMKLRNVKGKHWPGDL